MVRPPPNVNINAIGPATNAISNQQFFESNNRVYQKGIVVSRSSINLSGENLATLDFSGDGLINFAITDEVSKTLTEKDAENIDDLDSVNQTIRSENKQIRILAEAASSVINHVVNMEGMVRANSVVKKDGKIFLSGSNLD